MSGYFCVCITCMFAWPIDWLSFLWVKWSSKFISFKKKFKCDFACVFCMITNILFVYVNVCLYLNVSLVILYSTNHVYLHRQTRFELFWIGLRIRNAFGMNRNCKFHVCLFSQILICDLWAFGGFSLIWN